MVVCFFFFFFFFFFFLGGGGGGSKCLCYSVEYKTDYLLKPLVLLGQILTKLSGPLNRAGVGVGRSWIVKKSFFYDATNSKIVYKVR